MLHAFFELFSPNPRTPFESSTKTQWWIWEVKMLHRDKIKFGCHELVVEDSKGVRGFWLCNRVTFRWVATVCMYDTGKFF